MGKLQVVLNRHRASLVTLFGIITAVFAGDAVAATMGNVATNIVSSFASITKLITATAYLSGVGFAVGSIIKFKAHKDNPAQVPIGQPIGLLMVAAALLFLPTILGITGATMFGSTPTTAGPSGITI